MYKFSHRNCLRLTRIQARRTNFWRQNGCFRKVPIPIYIIQNHWKNKSFNEPFSFSWTVEYNEMHKFLLQNFLSTQTSRTNFWSQNGYFWKFSILHVQNLKKDVISQSFRFHFNCRTLKDNYIFYSKLLCSKWFELGDG